MAVNDDDGDDSDHYYIYHLQDIFRHKYIRRFEMVCGDVFHDLKLC